MIRKKKDLSVYVHIPFCVRKCAYCDFVSAPASKGEIEYYITQLTEEIRQFRALGNHYMVRTVFFGGGTPSLLDPALLKQVLDAVRNHFILAKDAEITVECNPGTLTEEKLRAYREMGVNRLSIGVQSACDEELRLLGRIHTWQEFLDNYRLARSLGFDNINIDLMSALPGQSLETWMDTLRQAADLEPEHISAYSLIIEEGTPFYERYSTREGRAMLPDEDLDREMYRQTRTYLESRGYHRYEISNYAKEGRECRHNLVYWQMGDYIGFGMAAYSCLEGRRFGNPTTYNEYWDFVPHAWENFRSTPEQSRKETVEEFMFLGLRVMKGVSKAEFRAKFGLDYEEVYGEVTRRLIGEGLLEEYDPEVPGEANGGSYDSDEPVVILHGVRSGQMIRLTERGIDVSNVALAEFLLDELPGVETK